MFRASQSTGLLGRAAVIGAALVLHAASADAVIVSGGNGMPAPANGYVGWWNGSSGVCVSPYWVMSAKHVGGAPGDSFLIKGKWYQCVEIVTNPVYDVQLIRVSSPLPGWHRLGTDAAAGDPVVLGGYGVTTTGPVTGNAGWNWSGQQEETWGANLLAGTGNLLQIIFNAPSNPQSVAYEATFSVHDSGAGLFTFGSDGALDLVGIAVSVTGWGESDYGSSAFCVNIDLVRNWAMPIIDPDQPVTSGVVAPRSFVSLPGLPEWVGGTVVVGALSTLRRRRHTAGTGEPGRR